MEGAVGGEEGERVEEEEWERSSRSKSSVVVTAT